MSIHKITAGPWGCSDLDALALFLGAGDSTHIGGRNRYQCSYVIHTDGTYFYAENGTTGKLDYGGPSDEGTATGTDAADVIQHAIDALPAYGGGTIYIKEGTYTLNTRIDVTSQGIYIVGESRLGTYLLAQNALNTYMIRFGDGVTELRRGGISHCRLDGNRANQTAGGCIEIYGMEEIFICDNLVVSAYDAGIKIGGTAARQAQFCYTHRNILRNNGRGIYEGDPVVSAAINNYTFFNDISGTINQAIHLEIVYESTIAFNSFWGTNLYGIYVNGGNGIRVAHNHILYATNQGIVIQSVNAPTGRTQVIGNDVMNNSQAGAGTFSDIYIDDSTYIQVIGNNCDAANQSNYCIEEAGTSNYNTVLGNNVQRGVTGQILSIGANTVVAYNMGYNPIAASTPVVGASPVTFGPYQYPAMIGIAGGTITSVTIRTQATGQAGAGTFAYYTLYPSDTCIIVYTVVPTVYLYPL